MQNSEEHVWKIRNSKLKVQHCVVIGGVGYSVDSTASISR